MGAVVVLVGAVVTRVRMRAGIVMMAVRVRVIMTVIATLILFQRRLSAQWGMADIVRAGSGVLRKRRWAGHEQL